MFCVMRRVVLVLAEHAEYEGLWPGLAFTRGRVWPHLGRETQYREVLFFCTGEDDPRLYNVLDSEIECWRGDACAPGISEHADAMWVHSQDHARLWAKQRAKGWLCARALRWFAHRFSCGTAASATATANSGADERQAGR